MSDLLDPLGLKTSVVAAGVAGGALRALSRRRYTVREAIAAPVCGALAAAYLTPLVSYYVRVTGLPLPPLENELATTHAIAFVIGVCAMWISDLALEAIYNRIAGRSPNIQNSP